jgi:Xaa-Pro dipeptidase
MESVFEKRIASLQTLIAKSDLDLVAIIAGPSQIYFSGLHFHLSERPAVLLVSADQEPAFIFPEFETDKVVHTPIHLAAFPYHESHADWVNTFSRAINRFNAGNLLIGVEPTAMRYLEMDLLGYHYDHIRFTSAAAMVETLRASKDEEEISHIRAAIRIAQTALKKTLPAIKAGVSEKEIANQLVINLLREGSDPELPFFPIVASGPNSANPHAVPGDRLLCEGDLLIIDWGARYQGYISDITRTFAIGSVSPQLEEVYRVVKTANQTARDLHSTEFTGKMIDDAARSVITDAGYGEAFLHRTGHGFGLEAHEPPYISAENSGFIPQGAAFTIEPGIYLRGVGGVRIEDDMRLLGQELETLTTLDRELIRLQGGS